MLLRLQMFRKMIFPNSAIAYLAVFITQIILLFCFFDFVFVPFSVSSLPFQTFITIFVFIPELILISRNLTSGASLSLFVHLLILYALFSLSSFII